jgi:hypothetical protein
MKFMDLVNALEVNGFFDQVGKNNIALAKQEILSSQFLFPEAVKRNHFADAEDLAEQGVLEFIAEMSPELARRGVHIPVVSVPLRPARERNPKTGEIVEVARSKLSVDDSIPDPSGTTYLRPVRGELPESGEYYRVAIGTRTRGIWNSQLSPEQCWEAGMCHTFILINQLLQDAGAQERIYGLYGGNDGQAVFLTPAQFDLIRGCEDIEETERPWEPYVVI